MCNGSKDISTLCLKFIFLKFLIALFFCPILISGQCNGSSILCNKKYDDVAYLTTHNAFNSSEDNFSLPNQNFNISNQLNDGVRGLMIDVYDHSGVTSVYHGSTILGSEPLIDYLIDIDSFLVNNPNEVVTIILECYVIADTIETLINQSGLDDFLYTHDPSSSWPTLQEMIDNNTRLVVFSDVDDASASQQWYHYVWDYAVETHYSVHHQKHFSCDFNRGDSINDLFIFNHFVTTPFGTGNHIVAVDVNANPFFINRAQECQLAQNKFPNFITVDFYDFGNTMDVVNTLNGVITNVDEFAELSNDNIRLFPNPTKDIVTIEIDGFHNKAIVEIFDISGRLLMTTDSSTIDIKGFAKGIYLFKVQYGEKIAELKVEKE